VNAKLNEADQNAQKTQKQLDEAEPRISAADEKASSATDMAGSAEYNLELSQRRAEAAQTYLVAQHNVPVCRTRIVGLGKDKPVNEEKTGEERQQNRRVDVTLFSADSAGAAKSHTSMN
jgi:outer membrane protein OmpA-like peptidoglycan-associated protein